MCHRLTTNITELYEIRPTGYQRVSVGQKEKAKTVYAVKLKSRQCMFMYNNRTDKSKNRLMQFFSKSTNIRVS